MALQDLRDWIVEPLPSGTPDVDETGSTFIENATLKAKHYSQLVSGLVLADDSGLCVDALGGRPGVHTARDGASAESRNQRVLDELAMLAGTSDSARRAASFRCAFVVARAGLVLWSTEAQLDGQITLEPVGNSGFGFDPIFWVPELRKSLAQLTSEEKNRCSARGQAISELRRFLVSQ
jgi:XTP/dITP diphosphohydrolase